MVTRAFRKCPVGFPDRVSLGASQRSLHFRKAWHSIAHEDRTWMRVAPHIFIAGVPKVLWLGGLTYPTSLLTAVLQQHLGRKMEYSPPRQRADGPKFTHGSSQFPSVSGQGLPERTWSYTQLSRAVEMEKKGPNSGHVKCKHDHSSNLGVPWGTLFSPATA